jgi:hypothetical protein
MKCYSTNEEDYSHESVCEAVQDILENGDVTTGDIVTLWEADAIKRSASYYVPDMAEHMLDAASGECGEYADTWDFSKKERESLQELIEKAVDKWADENKMQPSFYTVENSTPFSVRITDEDGGYEIIPGENS